tara:strand:- start:213 stop:518 length:306 start_codon:yes stop_codon:yes gene_type:complete
MSRHEDYMKAMIQQEELRMAQAKKQTDNIIDMVNSPPHYNRQGIECIEAIEAALTPEEFKGYCKGNNIKYTWRENYKGKEEDLRKAAWYLNRLLERLRDES